MNEDEKCLDSQLWHACAGGMVQIPSINSKVFYFPQGHAEHTQSPVDSDNSPRIPPLILCRVNHVKFMADTETDEVYAKISMTPLRTNELNYCEDNDGRLALGSNGSESLEKPSSFAKTLTPSDANNGGGFSIPRYCAETIFPRLNYSADPPAQEVLAMDVHGKIWKFRHVYRGTPRRHLLTTGWSNFINEKKLVAGDSIIFLRTRNSDLCVGIRRAKRGFGNWFDLPIGWKHPMGKCLKEGLSLYLKEEEEKFMIANTMSRGKGKAKSVMEATKLAVNGKPFEVVYYPRAGTPEFCVKASAVKAALRIRWCSGMRFKMAFETEDLSRISWFMGTVSDSYVYDPTRWPGSPWRLLQVSWDEPDLLQNVRSVSPWLVELVSNVPAMNSAQFSPPTTKPRILPFSDFALDVQHPTLMTPENLFLHHTGIQGARHGQYDPSSPELRSVPRLDPFSPPSRISAGLFVPNSAVDCGENSQRIKKKCRRHQFMLFGKVILTEEELCSISEYSSSDLNSTAIMSENLSIKPLFSNPDEEVDEIGHCKVFMESENVGRIVDLSMVKHTEDEPFLEFMKEARRLTIIMNSSSEKAASCDMTNGLFE